MQTIDLPKDLKRLTSPTAGSVEILKVPSMKYLMIDGVVREGETAQTSKEFQDAAAAILATCRALRSATKRLKKNPCTFTPMRLEGILWVDAGESDFSGSQEWQWTLMMPMPVQVRPAMLRRALRGIRKKKDSPFFAKLRLKAFHEGLCIQAMHVGPYAEEPTTIERLQRFAQEKGLLFRGKHHEIYLNDPRRTTPEKLRTILRHPVQKSGSKSGVRGLH